uniref:Opioid growth factor receptor (OGFr) conserved domain-containing protein n=1 Tax=Leptobrachium leishanense TaxID=445787 RepID=A0A8C5W8Z9_9ANUR
MPNYEFYRNWRKFEPKGEFIEIILHKWQDYERLELNHDYIQWLFPTQTQGRNFYSTPLNPQETRLMIDTSEVQQRLRRAYKMMLKFFGVKVMGEEEGDTEITEVERAENFASRFENLTINPHNNLRITRILHSLGELGAEEYQAPLVRFFLKEILIKNRLPRMKKSAMNFFIPAVRDSQDRQDLLFFAWRYYFPKEEFVWGSHEELAQYKANCLYIQCRKLTGEQEGVITRESDGKQSVLETTRRMRRMMIELAKGTLHLSPFMLEEGYQVCCGRVCYTWVPPTITGMCYLAKLVPIQRLRGEDTNTDTDTELHPRYPLVFERTKREMFAKIDRIWSWLPAWTGWGREMMMRLNSYVNLMDEILNRTSMDIQLLNLEVRELRKVQMIHDMAIEQISAALNGLCEMTMHYECCTFIKNTTHEVPDYYQVIQDHQ